MKSKKKYIYSAAVVALATFAIFSFEVPDMVEYRSSDTLPQEITKELKIPKIVHEKTPEPLKGIYMTACVAGLPSFRNKLVSLIEETELNTVIIDIKDYTGTVSFNTGIAEIDYLSGSGCKAPDMKEFIKELHDKQIYVIGRVTVFQDPLYTKARPELAVKKKSNGSTWKDRKGLSFIDVGAREYWDYIIQISKESEKIGFDEINFDYIRFPSDGNMYDISYTHTGTTTKKEMLRQFFEYLDHNLKDTPLKTSADLFGMVTTNKDDLGIGQVLENALPYFDYIAPMVYPSHYPSNFNGWPDPNKVPYEIVKFSMDEAARRAEKMASTSKHYWREANRAQDLATSSPVLIENFSGQIEELTLRQIERINKNQLRPWLQDNDYPVPYTSVMVRNQIQATYDAGLTSWMLWDSANTYTKEALLLK